MRKSAMEVMGETLPKISLSKFKTRRPRSLSLQWRPPLLGDVVKIQKKRLIVSLWVAPALLVCFASYLPGRAQSPESSAISLPTELRVQSPGWWPTKGEPARSAYAGPESCAECHELKAESQEQTPMAHAAVRAADSKRLREHDHLRFQLGPYSEQVVTQEQKSILTVSDGKSIFSADLLWAFGSGHMGQTFIYRRDGEFYESHVSFFTDTNGLDITPGQRPTVPSSSAEAAGRAIPQDEAAKCVGCHTTASTTKNQFDPSDPFLGVTCEACHGPGAKHVAAARAKTEKRGSGLILNPSQLSRVDYVDFCGACHRTWQDVVGHLTGIGIFNVRFAPYRLENSRCWEKGDARLNCVACHDPHKPLVHDSGSYDSVCLGCHVTTAGEKRMAIRPGAACPLAGKNCVTCHMPRVSPPNLHSAFTDHWIRIVRPNSSYPE
jgi:hypothetical protein